MIVDPGRLEERKRRLRLPGRREVELAADRKARLFRRHRGIERDLGHGLLLVAVPPSGTPFSRSSCRLLRETGGRASPAAVIRARATVDRVAGGITGSSHGLSVATEAGAHALLIRFVGELDLAGVPQARAAAEWAGRQPAGPPLVLDVSRVSFIDSTGVRMLLETKDEARRPVGLLSPSGAVLRVLDLTGLRGRFVELEDLEESTVRKLAVSPR